MISASRPLASALLAASLFLCAPALALGGQAPPASAVMDCAPYDGAAIHMRFNVSPGYFISAMLWGEALRQMHEGKASFSLDGRMSGAGTGSASYCRVGQFKPSVPQHQCEPLWGRFEFDVSGTRAGDKLRGRFYYQLKKGAETVIPFSVEIQKRPGGEVPCG